MGFSPREVATMSLWQFQAAASGWAEAKGAKGSDYLNQDDFDAASALLDEGQDRSE